MEMIDNIAQAIGIGSNLILIFLIFAAAAILTVIGLVIFLLIVVIRKNMQSGQEPRLKKEKKPKEPKARKEKGKAALPKQDRSQVEMDPNQQMDEESVPAEHQQNLVPEPEAEQEVVQPDTAASAVVPEPAAQKDIPSMQSIPEPAIQEPIAAVQPVAEAAPAPSKPIVEPLPEPPAQVTAAPEPAPAAASDSTADANNVPSATSEPEDNQLSDVVDVLLDKRGKKEHGGKGKRSKTAKLKERNNKKRSARALKQKAKKLAIPKTVQQTIPYLHVYPDTGIIETEQGEFTKSYLLDDVNYQVAKDEEQTEMFLKYAAFMNSFDPSTRFQITINQKNMNLDEFEADTMLPMEEDGLDHLREERNKLLREKIREGKNELVKEKYLTVSCNAQSYEAALSIFARLEAEIVENIKKIGGAIAHPLSSAKRLEILHDIYNPDAVGLFGNNMTLDSHGNLIFDKEKFRFDIMRRMGLSTKDMVGPDSFSFKSDYGMVGNKYFRTLFLRTVPQSLKDFFLKDLTDMEANMVTSLIYQPIDTQTALKMARQDIVNTNANMIEKQKQASKSGYSVDLINPELKAASEESNALRDDLTSKNQKLFYMTLVIVHFADTKEKLDSDTKAIQAIGRRHLVGINNLSWQQENGLDSALPLCNSKLKIKRSLTTESSAVFMPFVNQELNDRDGGMYYGNNMVSHNLIMLNRRNSKNGNGFIFGTPGSGKSMSAKQEMMTVLLSSKDDVIVIDPEGEYYPMAEMLGGEVVRIAPGSGVHINPFDIDLNVDGEDDPITMKSDFIGSICETIIGDRFGLTPGQRSLIDRCVKRVYEPYIESRDPVTGKYDQSKLPTLHDFFNMLKQQNGYDAMQLADGLEIYVTGSQNLFAYPTNVEYSKRFVVYDIKEIGNSMKSLGLLVVLDNIWNRIVAGREQGKHVWFFIDEIYLLFKVESSAEFLRNLYKRARKYGGIPTGITQNVSDLLENPTARTMISNCEYIQMLNQAPLDRAQLGELLNISPTQMSFITNASPGHGLIYDGTHIVPFVNQLPKNTMQYEAMTTKLSEVKEREERKREEQEKAEAEELSSDEAVEAEADAVALHHSDTESEAKV